MSISNPLIKKIIIFNYYPHQYAHADWINEITYISNFDRWMHTKRYKHIISNAILEKINGTNAICLDFSDHIKRIALIKNMSYFVLMLGTYVLNSGLILSISKKSVETWKLILSEKVYLDILSKKDKLPNTKNTRLINDLIHFSNHGNIDNIVKILMQSGIEVLSKLLFNEMSGNLWNRIILKLPKDFSYLQSNNFNSYSLSTLKDLIFMTAKDRIPEWKNLVK